MEYSHIVFDIDGTLIDSNHFSLLSLQEAVRLYDGREISINDLTFSIGKPGDSILKALGISNISYVNMLWDKCYEKYITQIQPFPEIETTLKEIYKAGYSLGIVTTKLRSEYKREFEIFQLHKYFHTSVCLDECSHAKPNPDPLYRYMDITHTHNHNILYIGDNEVDMQCAKNAVVDFAHARWGTQNLKLDAKYCLYHPEDLLKILGRGVNNYENRIGL